MDLDPLNGYNGSEQRFGCVVVLPSNACIAQTKGLAQSNFKPDVETLRLALNELSTSLCTQAPQNICKPSTLGKRE